MEWSKDGFTLLVYLKKARKMMIYHDESSKTAGIQESIDFQLKNYVELNYSNSINYINCSMSTGYTTGMNYLYIQFTRDNQVTSRPLSHTNPFLGEPICSQIRIQIEPQCGQRRQLQRTQTTSEG